MWLLIHAGIKSIRGASESQVSGAPESNHRHHDVIKGKHIFFEMRLNKRLSRKSRHWWFKTTSCSLWRHCNVHFHDVVPNNPPLAISSQKNSRWTSNAKGHFRNGTYYRCAVCRRTRWSCIETSVTEVTGVYSTTHGKRWSGKTHLIVYFAWFILFININARKPIHCGAVITRSFFSEIRTKGTP